MGKRLIGLGSDGKLNLRLPGGQEQPLNTQTEAYAFVLVDCSGSMSGAKLEHAKQGAADYSNQAIKKGYSVGLISFGTDAIFICNPLKDFRKIQDHVKQIDISGSTNLTSALEIAIEQCANLIGIRVILVATDGYPDDTKSAVIAADKAKNMGIKIMTIGTEDADLEFLNKIASSGDWSLSVHTENIRKGIAGAAGLLPEASE